MISNDRGSITLPAVLDSEMVDGVVWLPSRAPGLGCRNTWPPAPAIW